MTRHKKFPLFFKPMKKYTHLTVSSKLSAHDIAYDAMSRLVTFERVQGCMGGRRGHGGHAAAVSKL